jgi:hypothetical protein
VVSGSQFGEPLAEAAGESIPPRIRRRGHQGRAPSRNVQGWRRPPRSRPDQKPGPVPDGTTTIHDGSRAPLDRYAEEFPPTPVTLPWVHLGGKLMTVNLLVVDLDGMPFRRGGSGSLCGYRRSSGLGS